MDGVLTDTSGITTNKFYVYTDERNPRYSICCFRLGSQVKLSLPNELLNLFGGNPEENIYAVDHIICLRFEIKQPILKQLTLSKVCKSIIDIVALTPEEFKSNAGTISRRLRLLTFNQIITTKEYINKATFIRNLGTKVTLSEEVKPKIVEICKERFDKIYEVYRKYGLTNSWYDEYDPTRGSLWLDDDYNEDAINDKSICLEYTDHWGYGGSCHCYMELKFSQFEDSFIEALDKSLKSTRIASLKREIELLEAQLESKKTCLKELKNGNENE